MNLPKTLINFEKYKSLVCELVSRDLKIKYRRSFLGYLWSLLNPLLMMGVQAAVFSNRFKGDIANYPLYIICGNMIFTCYRESTTSAMNAIVSNSSLIRKVSVPQYIFPLSKVCTSFITTMFSFLAIIIVMIATKTKFHATIFLFWLPVVLLFVFCVGAGLFLAAVTVYFRDVQHLYSVFTMMLVYATPIFWTAADLHGKARLIANCNPIFHYIVVFRSLVMLGELPSITEILLCVVFCLAMLLIGAFSFMKLKDNFILYI